MKTIAVMPIGNEITLNQTYYYVKWPQVNQTCSYVECTSVIGLVFSLKLHLNMTIKVNHFTFIDLTVFFFVLRLYIPVNIFSVM